MPLPLRLHDAPTPVHFRPRRLAPALLAALVLLGSGAAGSPVRLTPIELERSARFEVSNELPYPVSVTVEPVLTNLRSSVVLPWTLVVPAGGREVLAELTPADPALPWSYTYRWWWTEGSFRAVPDEQAVYGLPYNPGYAFRTRRLDPGAIEDGPQAVEWMMPVGTPIMASRAGRVVRGYANPDPGTQATEATEVWILHEDGTLARYRGLQPAADAIPLGMQVDAGRSLGRSAARADGVSPSFRFDVVRALDGKRQAGVPLRFLTSKGVEVLEPGHLYMRPHDPTREATSRLPHNAVEDVVTCRGVGAQGPVDEAWEFSAHDVVHVHLRFGAPDAHAIRVEFRRKHAAEPEAIRRVQTNPEQTGAFVTLDLAGLAEPAGDWTVHTFVADEAVAELAFHVDSPGPGQGH